jgi:GAF domain-containing protein
VEATMSTSPIRYLQQENTRLRIENEAQRQEISTLRHYVHTLSELYQVSQRLHTEPNPWRTFVQQLDEVRRIVGAEEGSFSLLDRTTDELVFAIVHGPTAELMEGHRFRSDEGVAGWVLSNGGPVIINNPRQDWRFSSEIDDEFSFLTRSILCVAVMDDGEPIGVVELINKEHDDFTEADATLVSILGHIAAIALSRT